MRSALGGLVFPKTGWFRQEIKTCWSFPDALARTIVVLQFIVPANEKTIQSPIRIF
jgi:hypothetical protein